MAFLKASVGDAACLGLFASIEPGRQVNAATVCIASIRGIKPEGFADESECGPAALSGSAAHMLRIG
jgi:hypothetical protein